MCSAKNSALRQLALCLLALSAAGSACFSSDVGNNAKDTRVSTVSFEKNCTSRIDEFERKNIRPPATTVEDFPAEPTCAGHRFLGWNTERDGSGTPFTAQTPISFSNIILIVFAQWEQLNLGLEAAPVSGTVALTPLETDNYSERMSTFSLSVTGFGSEADANNAELDIGHVDGLSFQASSRFEKGVKTFSVNVEYDGKTAFPQGSATIQLNLKNIPEGYGYYVSGTKTTTIAVVDGQARSRPISLNQSNIQAFNSYAKTNGLDRHYRLVGDIVLEAPASPETSNWAAIGTRDSPFAGGFDGDGHTISGLLMNNSEDYQGLFGAIGTDTLIENLGLINLSVKGGNHVGALVGSNSGTVQNSYARGTVEGSSYVGGLVGYNGGTVQNSYAMASVVGDSGNNIGGLVGYNYPGTVRNSYATGSVSGFLYIGGVVGMNFSSDSYRIATVQNCLALNPVITGADTGRVVGVNAYTSTMANNRAFADMPGTWDYKGLANRDGADITADQLHIEHEFPAAFRTPPWTYWPGRLPGLFGQTVEMPSHIPTN
jgi:hypothetical protein